MMRPTADRDQEQKRSLKILNTQEAPNTASLSIGPSGGFRRALGAS